MDTKPADEAKGTQLLTAVERLVASNDSIREVVAVAQAKAKLKAASRNPDTLRELTAAELVKTYSNRAAIAGGASSLPALIPGIGSLVAGVAGTFAELTYLLKCEVELALALSHAYGFDLEAPRERQLAFLMASVGTYEAGGRSTISDLMKAEGVAIWNYGPRRASRFLVMAATGLALGYVWRGLLKALPIVGIGLGAGLNKVLTQRVGERVMSDLRTRRSLDEPPPAAKKTKKPARGKKPRAAKRPSAPRLKVVGLG